LPDPAAPQISEGLPLGRPPPVISSMPVIPVGVFNKDFWTTCFFGGILTCCLLIDFKNTEKEKTNKSISMHEPGYKG
jgi:hypothetical protein